MQKFISKKSIFAVLVVFLLIFIKVYYQHELLSTNFLAKAPNFSGLIGLPSSSCFPPASQAEIEKSIGTLVSFEKNLEDAQSPRYKTLIDMTRLSFELGEMVPAQDKQKWFEKGAGYARIMIGEEPRRVEGYYWHALNLCGICEISRAATALSTIPQIIKDLNAAIEVDPSYDQAGPLRVLGRILCKVPAWPISEGDLDQSLNLLRNAIKIAPDNSTNHLYLAETLIELNQETEACAELHLVMAASCHATSFERLKEDQEQASGLMANCGRRIGSDANTLEVKGSITKSEESASDFRN